MNSCIRDFNLHAQNLISLKSELNESLLNRSLSLLCTTSFDNFNCNSVESCQFFINLYKILSTCNRDSDALWTTISTLQQISKNLDARDAIINRYNFFPLLGNILETLVVHENIKRLLILMQDLSYGIIITWEEPYLDGLIKTLLREINVDDESLSYTALSVLINICYKNFPVSCLLLKYINATNFVENIKTFGILGNKMIIILEINNNLTAMDLYLFIKKSFTEIDKAIQNWNVPLLKHVVDFLINSKDFNQLNQALNEYENFENDILGLLQDLSTRNKIENSNNSDEHEKHLQNCLSLIYELLNFIVKITNSNSQLKLSPNVIQKMYEFLYNGIVSKYATEKVLDLFETIVKVADEDLICKISKELDVLHKIIEISENNNSNKYTTALQKLLIALLKNSKTEKIVISIVKESFFDKIFQSLLDENPEDLEISTFTIDDLSKYLYCLLVLIEFSNISKIAWIEKVDKMFTLKQIQFVLANGMFKNELLCNVVFEIISKIEYFPYKQVAKIMSNINEFVLPHQKKLKFNMNVCNCSINSNNVSLSVSKNCEERLNAVMDKIFNTRQHSNFDPATSELIELFNYKINILNTKIENLTKRLVNASHENTELCHEVNLNNIVSSKYHSLNYKMQLQHESLQTQMKDLEKQRDISKSMIEKLEKKFKEERHKFKNHAKNLEIKKAEIIELHKEINKIKVENEKQIDEIQKLKTVSEENLTRVTQLKQSLILTEEELNKKKDVIVNKEKENNNLNKNLEECREVVAKNGILIKHLEGQINEKNEKIRLIQCELDETEEMRKTILSLMESKSKKPKREH